MSEVPLYICRWGWARSALAGCIRAHSLGVQVQGLRSRIWFGVGFGWLYPSAQCVCPGFGITVQGIPQAAMGTFLTTRKSQALTVGRMILH